MYHAESSRSCCSSALSLILRSAHLSAFCWLEQWCILSHLQVLTKKKADLMAQYASESLLAEQADAKQLLNKK